MITHPRAADRPRVVGPLGLLRFIGPLASYHAGGGRGFAENAVKPEFAGGKRAALSRPRTAA